MTKRELLVGIYKRLSAKLGHPASFNDLLQVGITAAAIKHQFGNLTNLRNNSGFKNKVSNDLDAIYRMLGAKNAK